MENIRALSDWFWNDDFWLPPNVTWSDVQSSPEKPHIQYAEFGHLAYPVVIAAGINLTRAVLEACLFKPVGRKLGIKDHRPNRSKLDHPELELEFRRSHHWDHDTVVRLSRNIGASEREVEVWLRYRRMLSHPSKLQKFSESGWRFVFYTFLFWYGLFTLWNKSWFADIGNCWVNYPHHNMDSDVWWYYMTELAFYWGLFFTQFTGDVKRKDFWSMFFHHVVTIMLVSFSWVCHLHRIGTLVMIIHDVSDTFLECAKMLHYAKIEGVATALFGLFTLCWIVTRLGFFPTWIIYSITVEAPQLIQYFPAYLFFNLLLSSLLTLNIYWTYSILKVSYVTIISRSKIEKDIRSESSESFSSSETVDSTKNKKLQ